MVFRMASTAMLCILLLERFLNSEMDVFTEPVLRGLRVLEKAAVLATKNVMPADVQPKNQKITQFFLFSPDTGQKGVQLVMKGRVGFKLFKPNQETKIIIHGFLDNAKIAQWMHDMKDELLKLGRFNVIIVDWSHGNSIPYAQAAANTERVGEEIAQLVKILLKEHGANPGRFHLIGHSLGSHVAGYVGEQIKGLARISGLDPATHLFSQSSPRSKLDKTDAKFVDIIHTDGGGIGMIEPIGHVDFFPNGGEVQPGCTASNSLRSVFEKGIVEGVRNIICSHMRATVHFIDTINDRKECQMTGFRCASKEAYEAGECDSCKDGGCALMGYHVDTKRNYGNKAKYYLMTARNQPFCGFEYKITLHQLKAGRAWSLPFRRSSEWSSSDILHIFLYGNKGTSEFILEGKDKKPFQANHVVFSKSNLGPIHGAVIRWAKKPAARATGFAGALNSAIGRETQKSTHPFIDKIQVKLLKAVKARGTLPVYTLCIESKVSRQEVQKGSTFRSEYCS